MYNSTKGILDIGLAASLSKYPRNDPKSGEDLMGKIYTSH